MKKIILACTLVNLLLLESNHMYAQAVGISGFGTAPNASALLDIDATGMVQKGLLIPRVSLSSTTDITTISSPANSLMVYNTNASMTNGNGVGFYFYNTTATKWIYLASPSNGPGTSGQILKSNGVAAPTWENGSSVTSVTASAPLASSGGTTPNITITSPLPLTNGGTNASLTAANGGAVYSTATALAITAAGTSGQVLTSNGAAAPTWTTAGSAWGVTGNAGTVDGTNFIGTTDDVPFNIRVNNQKAGRIDASTTTYNTIFGYQAGNSNSGNNNTATGHQALFTNTIGNNNSALGYQALYYNVNASSNTAIGYQALYSNTATAGNIAIGSQALYTQSFSNGGTAYSTYNVAVGFKALYSNQPSNNSNGYQNIALGNFGLYSNTTGAANSAMGDSALYTNTVGANNTALGYRALLFNKTGSNATAIGTDAMLYANNTTTPFTNYNVAVGYEALRGSTNPAANIGQYNTAVGYQTLRVNTTGGWNTANGCQALFNCTGGENTAVGYQALYYNTTGAYNTAIGYQALDSNTNGAYNTALGYQAGINGTGHTNCTFIGAGSGLTTNRDNVTLLGYGIVNGQCTANNQVCIGNTAITEIRAQVTSITAYSDARWKTNVKENVAGLDFILRLKPVTYNVRPKELHKIWGTPDSLVSKIDHSDIEKQTCIGFIAQDVEKAALECGFNFPGIDVPRNSKEVYSLRYVDFIMPMVKAIQEQEEEITNLKSVEENLKTDSQNLKTRFLKLTAEVDAEMKLLEEMKK